ncbi:hypothetical protein RDI58_022674 [Solanum bulbocastanum]|uniref:Glutathione peroxidase n=1 Tax=Solanum bulbocastanum TaxID=147425 RepID=A0AAN8Y5I2_SOLBU
MGASKSVPQKSIHEFTVKDSKGKNVDLSIYKGKVLLVVNVASKWFFSLQFLIFCFEVLAFPCNQFLKQEPGTSEQAQEFACTRFSAEYPIFQKLNSGNTVVTAKCALTFSSLKYYMFLSPSEKKLVLEVLNLEIESKENDVIHLRFLVIDSPSVAVSSSIAIALIKGGPFGVQTGKSVERR